MLSSKSGSRLGYWTVSVPTSTRDNSTTMDPIQEAIEATESREAGECFPYRKVAKKKSSEMIG